VIAVAASTPRWYGGPPAAWLADRMGWSERESRTAIDRLRRAGLVTTNGDQELRARREAVELALAAWRASRDGTAASTERAREPRRRRPRWD
jgi:hypothetical protein